MFDLGIDIEEMQNSILGEGFLRERFPSRGFARRYRETAFMSGLLTTHCLRQSASCKRTKMARAPSTGRSSRNSSGLLDSRCRERCVACST